MRYAVATLLREADTRRMQAQFLRRGLGVVQQHLEAPKGHVIHTQLGATIHGGVG